MKVNIFLIKLLKRLVTDVLPTLFWVLLIFGFDKPYIAVLTILAAILHEIGHYSVLLWQKIDTGTPKGHISGFRLKGRSLSSYGAEMALFAAGPLTNILVFLLTLPFSLRCEYIATFSLINLASAVSNLLPIRGYDGYGMLGAYFRSRECERAIILLDRISLLLCSVASLFALYLMDRLDVGYWIFAIFITATLSDIGQMVRSANF